MEKVYASQDGQIQVHLNRVTRCPDGFPAGYSWYGPRRKGPGRPPRWLEDLQKQGTPLEEKLDCKEPPELSDGRLQGSSPKMSDRGSKPCDVSKTRPTQGGGVNVDSQPPMRTRSCVINPPSRLMTMISLGTSSITAGDV